MIEKKIRRKDIYKGKIVHLVCDDVMLENGNEAKREVVMHPGGVAIALKDENNKYFYSVKTIADFIRTNLNG